MASNEERPAYVEVRHLDRMVGPSYGLEDFRVLMNDQNVDSAVIPKNEEFLGDNETAVLIENGRRSIHTMLENNGFSKVDSGLYVPQELAETY